MRFANERLKVLSPRTEPLRFGVEAPTDRRKLVVSFLRRLDLIDSFVSGNPASLSSDELDIVSSWSHLVAGQFVVLRQLKKHAIFLSVEAPFTAYGVVALTEPLEQITRSRLPVVVETVLLPFRGRVIYDGLLAGGSTTFRGGVRKRIEDAYRATKSSDGIVTSLPTQVSAEESGGSGFQPTKKAVRKKPVPDVKPVLEGILAMIDPFCRDHLTEEYRDLCYKLAERLARKRPSPLLRGRPETWACGIIRTIGWVNFLDDRSTLPFLKLTAIDKAFGIAESTAQGKSKIIRQLLKIRTFDQKWTLRSGLENNPTVWMLEVDGLIIDIRKAPISLQKEAFERGLIPFIPDEDF
ncbi:DUF6398 domain-containing protein [Verrucomicrobia bacterium]|nr:DUF6398 domain-containing protein [Verrucomicrobiota bacterium]